MDGKYWLMSVLMVSGLASSLGGCSSTVGYYDPYYPEYYSDFGSWTVIQRPIGVVDDWTRRAFRHSYYQGFAIARHNSPVITYTATQRERSYEVVLTPRNDSTQVEVRARVGTDQWDHEQAKRLLGQILAQYQAERSQE
jgi:hypothetical protein